MSNARIIEIPATRQIRSGKNNTMRKMRVAAYCRVSTEEEEQQGSFETQKLYYTEKINSTSEWELAGIYADDGISGIHTKKRDGFNQMIQDCKKKKIDLILTKSISRFARNTLDSIQYVRMLKAIGIAVIFEKENINTSTMNSEMILTVLSAFAQAESESISQNVARGKRMGFRQGKFPFPYGQILLDGILRQMKAGENLKAQLQKQLEKAQQEFDRLLEMSLELDESTPFLDDKLRKLSGKIKILKANIAESTDGKGEDEEATKQLTAQDLLIKEYDDILTARIIEKVIVHSRQEIEIYFIGGYTQKIDLI